MHRKGSSGYNQGSGNVRKYLLITLSHAERRAVSQELVRDRLLMLFDCQSVVLSKESHQEGGFHYHIGVKNRLASRYRAAKEIRESFPEFDGAQCDVRFLFEGKQPLKCFLSKCQFQDKIKNVG